MRANIQELVTQTNAAARDPRAHDGRPLVVDVNELLIRAPGNPASSDFDPSQASFNPEKMTFILHAMSEGRQVYLSSETYPEALVDSVAQYLGLSTVRSVAEQPAELSRVEPPRNLDNADSATAPKVGVRTWLKLLRVHQYAKNALVLVPLATAHKFAAATEAKALIAAVAFSLCASGAYILNDMLDVKADRAHPTKRHRPIASGAISANQASYVMALVLIAAATIAASISLAFAGVLLGYFFLTTAYSFRLKRIAIVDVVALATLYSIRVIGGAVAIDVVVSEWLLAFSLFIFMSLALVKRHIELDRQTGNGPLAARDYQTSDKPMVAILAAAAGFNAVVIFTLYISSDAVRSLYSHPQLLWAGCPILMYWIGRVMLLAQRGLIDDDPVVFALKDRASWLALGAIGLILLVAM